MKQKQYSPLSKAEMSLTLYAANNGYYNDVPVSKALAFEAGFASYARANFSEVLEAINNSGDLSAANEEVIKKALVEFKAIFLVD